MFDLSKEAAAKATINRYLALTRSILLRSRDEWEWIDKAVERIESGRGGNVVNLVTLMSRPEMKKTA